MPALVITTEGDVKRSSVPSDQSGHLPWMYEQISCQTVDVVRLPHGQDMWIDDEGLLTDKPVNILATIWARYFGGLDVIIHGDALLAKSDDDGNTVEMSDREVIATILTLDKAMGMFMEKLAGDDNGVEVIRMPDISLN